MDGKLKKKRAEKYENKVSLDTSFEEALKLTFGHKEQQYTDEEVKAKLKGLKKKKK